MKAEYVGQSLLAVVIGIGGYQFLTKDRAEPSHSIPAPSYTAPAPRPQEPLAASQWTCYEASFGDGSKYDECFALREKCEAEREKLYDAKKEKTEISECRGTRGAFVLAFEKANTGNIIYTAHLSERICESLRGLALESDSQDRVSACVAFSDPAELAK